MTVQDIAQFACETTGDISSEALNYAKRAIRLKYVTLYDAHNWRESMRTIDGILLDSTLNGAFFLPYDAEEVIFCSLSYDQQFYARLNYRERDWIELHAPFSVALPGALPSFYRAENLAWPDTPVGTVTFMTSSPSPFSIYIAGRDNNDYPISERFILQGISTGGSYTPGSVSTAYSYKTVITLSKDVTTFPLIITAGGSTISMPPALTELVFTQLVLYPPPLSPAYVRVQVKLKPDSLDDDMSVPRISHIWDALISFTTSALWKRLQQVQKAQADNQDAMDHVKAAINVEKNQAEFFQQVVPTIYDQGDYIGSATGIGTSSYPWG